jgi:hypothetical protein
MSVLRLGGFRIDTFVCTNCGDEYPLKAAAIHVNLGSPEQSSHVSIGQRAKR